MYLCNGHFIKKSSTRRFRKINILQNKMTFFINVNMTTKYVGDENNEINFSSGQNEFSQTHLEPDNRNTFNRSDFGNQRHFLTHFLFRLKHRTSKHIKSRRPLP